MLRADGSGHRCHHNRKRDAARAAVRAERQAARTTWAPHKDPDKVPAGFHARRMTVARNADGEITQTWAQSIIDADHRVQSVIDALDGLADKIPREPLIVPPAACDADLLAVYPMGDPHIGMYAWAPETGASFDLDIAERTLVSAVDHLVALAPAAETALILNLGDFFHADSQENRTRRSGHQLDVDSRYSKVLAVGIRVMCRIIDRALEKHARVIVRNEIGNHDDHSSLALSLALAHHYHDNPRAQIDTSPAKFWYYRLGRCLLATTHGDTAKMPQLGGIMSADRPEDWGQTDAQARRWYTGHVHKESVIELPGCVVESFRTLASRDAWTAAAGYRSGRDMRLDVWHRQHGMDRRHIVGIGRLQ